MFDIRKDPACLTNLAAQRENQAYIKIGNRLQEKLFGELKDQNDPRMFGNGHIFDEYLYADSTGRHFYERYMSGELTKKDAPWVNPSDFEKKPNNH